MSIKVDKLMYIFRNASRRGDRAGVKDQYVAAPLLDTAELERSRRTNLKISRLLSKEALQRPGSTCPAIEKQTMLSGSAHSPKC